MPLDFKHQPGFKIRVLQQNAVAIFMEEYRGYNVTPLQFAILNMLKKNPGADQKALAEAIEIDRAMVGDIIARLEKRNIVDRYPSKQDKRSKVLYLTVEGQKLESLVDRQMAEVQKRILDPLTNEEREQFLYLLSKLNEA